MMLKTRLILVTTLGLALSASLAPAQAQHIMPDFSCPRPVPAEGLAQAICDNPAMSREEMVFEQVYYALRQVRGQVGWQALKVRAIGLSNQLRETCSIPSAGAADQTMPANAAACYIAETEKQRQALLEELSGAAREESARPIEQHMALQQRLVDLGYLPAGTAVDGVYGEATRNAVATWQRVTRRPDTAGFISDADATALEQNRTSAPVNSLPEDREAPARAVSVLVTAQPKASVSFDVDSNTVDQWEIKRVDRKGVTSCNMLDKGLPGGATLELLAIKGMPGMSVVLSNPEWKLPDAVPIEVQAGFSADTILLLNGTTHGPTKVVVSLAPDGVVEWLHRLTSAPTMQLSFESVEPDWSVNLADISQALHAMGNCLRKSGINDFVTPSNGDVVKGVGPTVPVSTSTTQPLADVPADLKRTAEQSPTPSRQNITSAASCSALGLAYDSTAPIDGGSIAVISQGVLERLNDLTSQIDNHNCQNFIEKDNSIAPIYVRSGDRESLNAMWSGTAQLCYSMVQRDCGEIDPDPNNGSNAPEYSCRWIKLIANCRDWSRILQQ